jgi:enterochelin esterase-like enzyme
MMRLNKIACACILACCAIPGFPQKNSNPNSGGAIVSMRLVSNILRGTITTVDSNRMVIVYLPPSYAQSKKSYPVVYFLHSIFTSAEKILADRKLVRLIETGLANNHVKEFILVVADYSSPTTGSLYENSPATGRWIDFTIQELLPFIDSNFRTLRHSESRAIVGEMMGGRGAFCLACKTRTFSVQFMR